MLSIIIFFILNLINVILGTMRSILTVKASPTVAMIINTISYTFYAGIVKMTTGQEMWIVLTVTAVTNIVGVYIAKWVVKKFSKDKLWKIETNFKKGNTSPYADFIAWLKEFASDNEIGYSLQETKKHYIINFYCYTQKQSLAVREFVKDNNGKYFASESKTL